MNCCGQERSTNFCPECGRAIDPTEGLRGLLRYLTEQLARFTKVLEAHKSRLSQLERTAEAPPYYADRLRSSKRSVAVAQRKVQQFSDWRDAVHCAIDGP
jgi:hypothetical protein